MPSSRVSAPTCVTRTSTGAPRLMLPATTAAPQGLATGTLSPVSSDSSARLSPSTTLPSAGKAWPTGTRTRSPGASRCTLTVSTPPPANTRSAVSGMPASAASSTWATRWRARVSSRRPASKKLTNMVSESKYTSWPNRPSGSKVAPLLATKVTNTPSATGTSMPMRRARRQRQAPLMKGPAENTITGSVNSQLPQLSNCRRSGASSSPLAT